MRTSWRWMDPATVEQHVRAALAGARTPGGRSSMPRRFTPGDARAVRLMPAWVERAGLLRSRGTWWLWCEPRRRARGRGAQLVLVVPEGRYAVDLLDVGTSTWFSRESAAGAPLVVGLPSATGPLLGRIRRLSSRAPVPGRAEAEA